MRKRLIGKLHDVQKWRRGARTPMPLSPTEYGRAIDDCIRILRRLSDEQFNGLMNDNNRKEQEILP